jgi:hypothetical protein
MNLMNSKRPIFALLTCCGLSFGASHLLADARPSAAYLPDFGVAQVVEGGRLKVERYIEYTETRTITTPLPPGLKVVAGAGTTVGPVSRTEVVPALVSQTSYLELHEARARRIDGTAVSPKVLAEELKDAVPVIILERDGPVGLPFAKLFVPKSLVLILTPPDAPTLVVPPPQQR